MRKNLPILVVLYVALRRLTILSASQASLFFIACLTGTQLYGFNEDFYNSISGNQIVMDSFFIVQDDKFLTPQAADVDTNLLVRNTVSFEICKDSLQIPASDFTCQVDLEIEWWDWDNTHHSINKSLLINFDPTAFSTYTNRKSYVFYGGHKMKVTILSVLGPPGPPIEEVLLLSGQIHIERKYLFDCDEQTIITKTYGSANEKLLLNWTGIPGAEEYDLEWTFYDEESEVVRTLGSRPSDSDFHWLYHNNATRVTLPAPLLEFELSTVYPAGYIFYRVRGIRYGITGLREEGEWTSAVSAQISSYNDKFDVSGHADTLNWTSQMVFAEEGKNIHSVSYFDGSLRTRQGVTLSRANDMVIVNETLYDHQGRAAVQVMPTPVSDFSNHLKYYENFTRFYTGSTDVPYTREHFDLDVASCTTLVAEPAYDHFGASRYYSTENSRKTIRPNGFLPDAEDYPFSQTEYTDDLTGRIRRQGGVGPDFQLGSDHETQYLYGKPSQLEIDMLFGNDVGPASHYQKNAMKDANGQITVTYLDAHGRTIATALVPEGPDNLEALLETYPTASTEKGLLDNLPLQDGAVVSNYSLPVTTEGTHTFNYTLDSASYREACMNGEVCFDCLYDLTITITSNCPGNFNSGSPFVYDTMNFTFPNFDTLCATDAVGIIKPFELFLPVGEYQITKILKVNGDALNYYTEQFIRQPNCYQDLDDIYNELEGALEFDGCGFTCEKCLESLDTYENFLDDFIDDIVNGGGTPTATDTAAAMEIYEELKAQCDYLCSELSECDRMREVMLADVTPYGQYGTYTVDASGVYSPGDVVSVFEEDRYKEPFSPYLDENGDPAKVLIGGHLFSPEDLSMKDFIENWQDSWAESLLEYHPEHCALDWCEANSASNAYDSLMWATETYEEAVELYLLNPFGEENPDPFFTEGGPGFADSIRIINWFDDYIAGACETFTIYDVIWSVVLCDGILPCPYDTSGICTGERDLYWTAFRNIYQAIKYDIKVENMKDYIRENGCPDIDCVGVPTCSEHTPVNPYAEKEARILDFEFFDQPNQIDPMGWLEDQAEESFGSTVDLSCDGVCEINADYWMHALSGCVSMTPTDSAEIRERFIAVCEMGCDMDHPMGSTTTPDPAQLTAFGDYSFSDVIEDVLDKYDCDTLCSALLIDFPGTYDDPIYLSPKVQLDTPDVCVCENLETLEDCYDAMVTEEISTFNDFLDYLNSLSEVKLTQGELDSLQFFCGETECKFMSQAIYLPPYLECDRCKTCDEVETAETEFVSNCPYDPGTSAYEKLFTKWMNNRLGLNLDYDSYQDFLTTCDGSILPLCEDVTLLCPGAWFESGSLDTTCTDYLLLLAQTTAEIVFESHLDSVKAAFRARYVSHCMDAVESFTASSVSPEYHFTLYYYDQAGNLERTVPPRGVDLLSSSELLDVAAHRADPGSNPPVFASHTKVTKYHYNTFNQVYRQETPDGGVTLFWYDRAGRPVVTQDADQAGDDEYTYTIYDALGRVIETGEKTTATAMTEAIGYNPSSLDSWIHSSTANTRKQVIRTYYDNEEFDLTDALGMAGQENLRTRVASVSYEEVNDDDDDTYDYASHYSYDIAGNVKTLVQEVTALDNFDRKFFRIDYEYDLISGNVNAVYYQRDSADQFIHRYTYDADNRLVMTETSPDGFTWDNDARYSYYHHGPLARVELGDQAVQGTDYAYTLQGWLKGMNASTLQNDTDLDTNFDMGKDGWNPDGGTVYNPNQYVGRDALAWTIGYYDGDYSQVYVNNTKSSINYNPRFEMTYSGYDFNTASHSLFNGNIRHIVSHIKGMGADPMGYAYGYDQLHRLKTMDAWTKMGATLDYDWDFSIMLAAYQTKINYDADGNIKNLVRHGDDPLPMDSLTYFYYTGTNRLQRVTDVVSSGNYPNDIDNQTNDPNYDYYDNGNLKEDLQEGIDLLWNAYGKVLEVNNSGASRKTLFGYDAGQNRVMKAEVDVSGTDTVRTYYVRDAQGNVMAVYRQHGDTLHWQEQHLYGSSRLGMYRPGLELTPDGPGVPDSLWEHMMGIRAYELTDHLGNVMAVISDKKLPEETGTPDDIADYYEPELLSASDYYPFGMQMPGRNYMAEGYRFGFNGKEKDDNNEWGNLTHYDYGFRIHNPALGRFLSVDPLARDYAFYTPYQFAGNNPIKFIDLDGLEQYDPEAKPTGITHITLATVPYGIEEPSRSISIDSDYDLVPVTGKDGAVQYWKGRLYTERGYRDDYVVGPFDFATFKKNASAYKMNAEIANTAIYLSGGASGILDGYIDVMSNPWSWVAGANIWAAGTPGNLVRNTDDVIAEAPSIANVAGEGFGGGMKGVAWEKISGIVRDAAKGKGNFGLGSGTWNEAMAAGRSWVGEGFTIAGEGKVMLSADRLRQFRLPSYKPKLDKTQANFEWRNVDNGRWQGNGHLDVIKP